MVAFIVIGGVLFLAIITVLVCIGASGSDAHIDRRESERNTDELRDTMLRLTARK
jgi:uncharacterized membrane protein